MLALCRRAQARWLSSTASKPGQRRVLLKPSVVIAGVSSAIAAYLALRDQPYSLPPRTEKSLNPSKFTPATLVKSVQTSSDTRLLTLSLPLDAIPQDNRELTPIWSVFVKDDDIQVERPYTPLEGVDESGNMSFWIKKYDHGEVARWLHAKQPGSSIELRGPVKTWTWKDDTWDDIIMVSGGTGITPFYQLLHHVFSSKNECKGRLTLLHASKTPADLPPANVMEFLHGVAEQHPNNFRFRVFVDSLDVSQQHEVKIPMDITCDRIGKSALQDALRLKKTMPWWKALFWPTNVPAVAEDRKVIVLVCGPEQMVNAIAGPYGRNYAQGKVGGILGELGLRSHQVWKL
ncbi:hypothetical protein F5J12DRAFT_711238 [Pisolithus orientalis]|uniref:uncharacterized protein n=1 Tax=Pisolithus orientalis TaxID=936130 RepID=UPI002225499A|nr:uncharacterized protein F5J12DRAFT_711238 [Pisolithus orientalis]KAI6035451.1 hypothetical protein F5J12DRAFT_711238 [Pisolithus orientalis]